MKYVYLIFGWAFGLFFFMLFWLSLLSRHYLPSLFVLLITLLLIPPVRHWMSTGLGIPLPVWLRTVIIPLFLILFIFLIFKGMGNKYSIYKNPEIEQRLMTIYQESMIQWPVPYQSRFIDTQYGKVHVIISGPEDAPPIILLHASAMASWPWLYNIAGLNNYYRTYAIDTIGDAGRSELTSMENYPADGKALTELYQYLMDQFGIEKACFIGASQGGFIATNVALHAPERVTVLILCGPMGYTGTTSSVLRILFTTMFPLKPIQQSATHWAFGDDPEIHQAVGDWFATILEGVISRQARPQPFSAEQLQSLKMPVLLLLGKRDGLVGNPEDARRLVRHIPDAQVEVLDTGHLISAEKPEEFNKLVCDFIERRIPSNF